MAKKKPFKETNAYKIIVGATSLIPGIGPALSSVLSGSSSIGDALQSISGSDATAEDKHRLTELLLKADRDEAREITSRWQVDSQGQSWLTRNIRPLVFAATFCFLVLFTLLDSFDLGFDLSAEWVSLWKTLGITVFGGYFGARTLDKGIKAYKQT